MPTQAYLEIVHPNGDVLFYPLDSGKGITTVGRHANNDVVINHPDVELFHAVLDYRQKPCQLIGLSEGGEHSLSPGASMALRHCDVFEIAGHTLILFDADHAVAQPGAATAQAVSPASFTADVPQSSPPPAVVAPRRHILPTGFHVASLIGPGLTALAAIGVVILIGLMVQQIVGQAAADVRQAQGSETKKAAPVSARVRHSDSSGEAIPVALARNAAGQVNTHEMTYEAMFKEIAQDYELDWRMLAEQAYRESRLDPLTLGDRREIGLMQILPSTWDEWAPKVGATDPWDPYSNVSVAAAYLDYLKGYCSDIGYPGDECMLVAYNWGPYNLRQLFDNGGDWGQVPAKTRYYAYNVLLATETDAANHLAGLSTNPRQVAVR